MLPFSDYKYIETARDSVYNRKKIKTINQYLADLREFQVGVSVDNRNFYRSYLRFPQEFYDHFMLKHTVAGYKGKSVADYLLLEIDHHATENRIKGATDLLMQVLGAVSKYVDPNELDIDFSGSGGYHVALDGSFFGFEPSESTPAVLKRIVNLILPDDLIADTNAKANGVDMSVFRLTGFVRQRGTLNASEKGDTTWRGFKTKIPASQFEGILKDPERRIREVCSAPSPLCDDDITNSKYWEKPSIPSLVDLYRQAKDELAQEQKTKPKYVAVDTGFTPQSDTMKPCIAAALRAVTRDELREGDGRNNTFAMLTAYFRKIFPQEDMLLQTMLMLNNNLSDPQDDIDIERTVKQSLQHNYGVGCGNPDSSFGNMRWCARGQREACPEYLKKHSSDNNHVSLGQAFLNLKSKLGNGAGGITSSLTKLNELSPYIEPPRKIIFQGGSTSGKTALFLRELLHWTKIAKEKGQIICLGSPEESPEDVAENIAMRLTNKTRKELYREGAKVLNNVLELFESSDALQIQHTANITVGEWKKSILAAEKATGKKCMIAAFDGILALRPSERNFGELPADTQAKELVALPSELNCVLAVVHHLPKAEKGQSNNATVADIEGGRGTGFYGIFFDTVISVSRGELGQVLATVMKYRRIWDEIPLWFLKRKPVELFFSKFYSLHEPDELEVVGLENFDEQIRDEFNFNRDVQLWESKQLNGQH